MVGRGFGRVWPDIVFLLMMLMRRHFGDLCFRGRENDEEEEKEKLGNLPRK